MKERKVAKAPGYTLSDFPDDILIYILSFLPAILAVRTSILSSRWKHLYKGVPNIDSSIKEIYIFRETVEIIESLRVHMREMHEAVDPLVISEKKGLMKGIFETMASARVKISRFQGDVRGVLENMDAVLELRDALTSEQHSDEEEEELENEDDDDDDDDDYDEGSESG